MAKRSAAMFLTGRTSSPRACGLGIPPATRASMRKSTIGLVLLPASPAQRFGRIAIYRPRVYHLIRSLRPSLDDRSWKRSAFSP